ncbi:DNA cytosine methyltransferase [Micromonospora carbonacea]|uniref:DNA cytosine methyltransferase n=1 Tax=Micromonospora carbonacea TaxID=47853 RepID=UPI003720A6AE
MAGRDTRRIRPVTNTCVAPIRVGITGQHSSVWNHVAAAVRVLRPRLLFVENVAALLRRGLDVVHADLAEIGYDTSWLCLRASDIGAVHQRDRLFLLAAPTHQPGGEGGADVADTVRP